MEAQSFVSALSSGDVTEAADATTLGGAKWKEAMPSLLLQSGIVRFDEAAREAFENGLDERPMPPIDSLTPEQTDIRDDTAWVGPDKGSVRLLRVGGHWKVDAELFVDDSIDLDRAQAMHAELLRLAERVEAGEFATRDEAMGAYNGTVIIGALRGIGQGQATRPTTKPVE